MTDEEAMGGEIAGHDFAVMAAAILDALIPKLDDIIDARLRELMEQEQEQQVAMYREQVLAACMELAITPGELAKVRANGRATTGG